LKESPGRGIDSASTRGGETMKINLTLDLTQLMAFWGTVVSTIAVTWNIVRGLMDRRKLMVSGHVGNFLPSEDPEKLYFYVVMTNTGRRPIVVSTYGIVPKKRKGEKGEIRTLIMPRALPKVLNEGQFHIEFTETLDFGGREVIGVYALDSSGKEWRAKRKNVKLLKKNLLEAIKTQAA
jgi:hypothetical protein